jgi:hypothetical protein
MIHYRFEKIVILLIAIIPAYFTQMGATKLLGLTPTQAELQYLKIDSFVSGRGGRYYFAIVLYSFELNGVKYLGERLYASHNESRDWLPFDSDVSQILEDSKKNRLVAYVDENNPEFSVLKRRFDPIGIVLHSFALLFLFGFLYGKKRVLVVDKKTRKGTFIKTDFSLYDIRRNKWNSK